MDRLKGRIMGTKKDHTEQLDLIDSASEISDTDTISLDLSDMSTSSVDNQWLSRNSIASSSLDTITLGSALGSMSISGGSPVYTIGSMSGVGGAGGYNWSNIATTTTNQLSAVDINSSQGSGIIDVRGENADIKINGVSLCDTLKAIQDRLNLLQPNPELEAEWDQLRELGEQYRKLEAEFKEKTKMWNTLKSMPPPEIK